MLLKAVSREETAPELFIADLVAKEANCPVPGELAAAGATATA